MPAPQVAPLPANFTLASGYVIRITAVDSTSGNLVNNVTVSNVSIDVDPVPVAGPLTNPVFLPNFSLGDVAA